MDVYRTHSELVRRHRSMLAYNDCRTAVFAALRDDDLDGAVQALHYGAAALDHWGGLDRLQELSTSIHATS